MLPYTYNTNDDHDQKGLASNDSKAVETHFPAENIPLGLNMLEMKSSHRGSYGVNSYIKGIEPVDDKYQTFKSTAHLDPWNRTNLIGAGCTWFDVSKWDTQFQFGRESGGMLLELVGAESINVSFDTTRPFEQAPKIVVWLYSLAMQNESGLKAYATDVTTTGFKLKLERTGSPELQTFECQVSWVAVPSNWPNVTAGAFEISDNGDHLPEYKTDIAFDKSFQRAPRVLVALNEVLASGPDGLRVETKAENVTAQGMTLSVKSWGGSYISQAGAQYIAIVD